ncbi:MAG TPA: hypothetical protein VFB12_02365 [Ktedonobacteraceae bacterium]|nr:hypothetical protein [Ktedonobacteraceae bacterium]
MSQQQPDAPYSPQDHLITVQTASGPQPHYPFSWRQHEFRLRYSGGVLDAQILQVDLERDCVVVKVTVRENDLGNCAGVGLACGSLTLISQVTERAKAAALADPKIGCPWPVLFADQVEMLQIVEAEKPEALLHNGSQPEIQQSSNPASQKNGKPSGYEHKPALTVESVQAFFFKAYQVPVARQENAWKDAKRRWLGREIEDGDLTEGDLNILNGKSSQKWQHDHAPREQQGTKNGTGRKAS